MWSMQTIGFEYTGVAKLNPEIRAIFAGSPEAHTIPFGQSSAYENLSSIRWLI